MYYMTTYPSPVGLLTLAADEENLVGLWIEGQKYHGGIMQEAMAKKDEIPVFDAAKKWLDRYFTGGQPGSAELPLAPIGSDFQKSVWHLLCEIPYGEVTTYGQIAKTIAQKAGKETWSAQAVGGAVAHNPVSIIIPCHRVVGSNGSLTGYAGGIGIKIKLLEGEGTDMSRLFVPKKGTAL
ncbi:MAG: methylated-DNA--[protein]-cysteine S-methyltransferase [Lachnospiraceae bacterium]|nr:methylated-DNA--[protein]-cysteine S-methyltransferase [Lachnospiraceae bacterium]